jgi:Chlamydia polymorphic membrane protein (Chlamydia_PMP) repeat
MNKQMKTSHSNTCRILLATCFSALCCIALTTQAATITVTNTNDSGAGSLRQAIADAHNSDTVRFGVTGVITLATGELLVDKSIIISGPGSDNLTIDANYSSRVFHVSGGVTATVSGLTITNGSANGTDLYGGGGIYNDHSTLALSNCMLSGNYGEYGGGSIYNGNATLVVDGCTLSGNYAPGAGGAIFNDGSNGSATLTVTNSTISGNHSARPGGAGNGGGIFNDGSYGSATLTVINSTFSDNFANTAGPSGGGAIYNYGQFGSATLTVTSSTFSGNSAYYGAGVHNDGIYGSATATIRNTIFNRGALGANVYNYFSGSVSSLGYNLIDDDGSGFLTATGDQINTDPMLGPLQDNGGPTFTHALLPGSPAIDAGKNFTADTTDQRGPGFLRTFDYASVANAAGGDGTDIGAFEVQPPAPAYAGHVQPPINTDGSSTFNFRRGVVPVKFNLTQGGVATCDLPPATIAVTRTAGGVIGSVNESVYSSNADTGSNFRIDNCQYAYNLNSRALGIGTYRVDILINGQVVGNAVFALN